MKGNILVAYASQRGATKEIAEKIGEVIRQAGLQADVLPAGNVRDLAPYAAVILGSAVYIGKWEKAAAQFLQLHETALAGRPVWLFSSGPTGTGDPVALLRGWRLPTELKPIADRIHPRDITVFHGKINPKQLNFLQRWVVSKMVKVPFGDFRDWKTISAWAAMISDTLTQTEHSIA